MKTLSIARARFSSVLNRFAKDENGNAPIETILLVALTAVLLTLGFKFLWGTNNDGIVATMIQNVIDLFKTGVTGLLKF